jgi:hypothetical protein
MGQLQSLDISFLEFTSDELYVLSYLPYISELECRYMPHLFMGELQIFGEMPSLMRLDLRESMQTLKRVKSPLKLVAHVPWVLT